MRARNEERLDGDGVCPLEAYADVGVDYDKRNEREATAEDSAVALAGVRSRFDHGRLSCDPDLTMDTDAYIGCPA
ncbi:hypothetical protein JI721_09160 [Alicyclobacillus cycloheptanicus]|uniref:Uncharacterized protein n=1 Tax=Alicyclobacillus cycloheptanicus TaxID=1457 RepID=A0ABT9XH57_9BACL|nr:hypothetical protein [Alicyclobacillus cycloheptanicus]MDQ0189640.1 hypothetical protein [Alicyclobacillus cycloheptanicus]WDL99944.1 hypothetical protein JI721_09160 [Alicyclobacillus cycloheptanicus]